jgi:hypothetical protein
MNLLTRKPDKRTYRLPPEYLRGVRDAVFRASGLRIDLDRLDGDEIYELHDLVGQIRRSSDEPGVVRVSPTYLAPDAQRRWESLASKAAGVPADHFDRQRKLAADEAKAAEQARKPKPHSTPWQPGTIVIPASIWRGLQDGGLRAGHLLLLTIILGCVQNETVPGGYGRVEDGVLVVRSVEHLIQPLDTDGYISRPAKALQQLAATGALIVERSNSETRVRLGDVLNKALS